MSSYKEELGRKTWNFLHTMSAGFEDEIPPEKQKDIKKFFKYLSKIYPCKKCQIFFYRYVNTIPMDTSSRLSIIKYLVDFHNVVNLKLNKPLYFNKY